MIKANEPEGSHLKPPRLRFDRVALGLLERLRASLQDDVPSGVTVVLTVTAPIRQDSKTTLAIEERVRELLGKRSGRVDLTDTIHGNEVQIRLMRGGNTSTSRLAGFVHNRDPVPNILFDITRALLERVRQSFAAGSWLVLAIEDEPLWMKTYAHVCAQLFAKTDLQRVILVDSNAGVTTLDS
jgi:hypothetical protein